ncbi:MAG: hypothetical protein H7839_14865 [Magnetococcus sp. YQC-5]
MNASSASGVAVLDPTHLLDELRLAGFSIVAGSGNLIISPGPDPEMTERIRQCKPELLAILTPLPLTEQEKSDIDWAFIRPLTDEEKRRIEEAFNNLRDQHVHALVAAGWHRGVVFDGLDPTQCETAGDVPGVIGLLMAGGRLVKIHPDRLDLEFPDGEPFSKIRGGCLLGGKVLDDFLRTGK